MAEPENQPVTPSPGATPKAPEPADVTAPTPPVPPTQQLPTQQPAAQQPPPKGPGLWRQATSTTGGVVAVAVAAALVGLLVLGVLGVGSALVVRAVSDRDHPREHRFDRSQSRPQERDPQGRQGGREQGGRQVTPQGPGTRNGKEQGPRAGSRDLMRGAQTLGQVEHGEFTVQRAGKATVMTLQRGSVTSVAAAKVAVKSQDGFAATYAVDAQTKGRASSVAVGDTVLVVAEKTGAKAVMIRVTKNRTVASR